MIPSLGSGEAKFQPTISPPPEPMFLTLSLKLLFLFSRVRLYEPMDSLINRVKYLEIYFRYSIDNFTHRLILGSESI